MRFCAIVSKIYTDMMSTIAKRYEIAAFLVGGIPGSFVYMATLFLCERTLKLDRSYGFIIGQLANSTLNFFIHKEWVFMEYGTKYSPRLIVRYISASAVYQLSAFLIMSGIGYLVSSNILALIIGTAPKSYVGFRFIKPLFQRKQ